MCQLCNGSGWVVAFDKDNRIYAFRSGCGEDVRRRVPPSVQVWNSFTQKNFSLNQHEKKVEKEVSKQPERDYKILSADPKAYEEDEEFIPF